jgi:hypothetical protein
VNEVHVADQADRGLQRGIAGDHPVSAALAGSPVEGQFRLVVREELFDAYLRHGGRSGFGNRILLRTPDRTRRPMVNLRARRAIQAPPCQRSNT